MQLIAVVGYKNSGKTTLIVRLIRALGARGLSVSTIKHVHHAIDLDRPGKDTFLHREAGAVDVAMYSGERWAILHERRGDPSAMDDLADLTNRLSPVDLVLVEGFKSLPLAKIQILAADGAIDDHAIALVADDPIADATVPVFARDDVDALAVFVEAHVRTGGGAG